MKEKKEFLTIFATYGSLDVVKQTLPSVIEETKRYGDAQLIVHDSTQLEHGQEEKWSYLRSLEQEFDFFLILSTNMSMAHARNMCLHLGQELFAPEYIAMMEDDHGYKEDLISDLIAAMKEYYGKVGANGLRYGLFSGCTEHFHNHHTSQQVDETSHLTANTQNSTSIRTHKVNSCFRCAPTAHWNNVLKGYDTDEYLISFFQTSLLNDRNYNKGFTNFFVKNGELMFSVDGVGRGVTAKTNIKLWDDKYTASDYRSRYIGKKNQDETTSSINNLKNKISKLINRKS